MPFPNPDIFTISSVFAAAPPGFGRQIGRIKSKNKILIISI